MKLVLVLAIAACGRSEPKAPPSTEPPSPPAPAAVIPATTKQLLTAIVPDWTSTTAELRLWKRDGHGWTAVGAPWTGVIGNAGAAWGTGLHGTGAPSGRTGPLKHEGDRKSPAGVFALPASYGYAPAPPSGTALPYTQVDANWECVDDPASPHYTQILDRRRQTVDWKSSEQMRRTDDLYTWVVDVAHNPAHKAGDGSCIFLHVWRGEASSTVGCTAMPEPKLAELITLLAPADAPAYVLLPKGEYKALAEAWQLPRQ